MYISEIRNADLPEDVAKAAPEFLTEERKSGIKEQLSQLLEDELSMLELYASDRLADEAARRAERFLASVLAGDADAAMQLFGDEHGSDRYRTYQAGSSEPWAELIHGSLFETSGIALRRKIVESHKELFESERIKDLESVVEGLTRQVRQLDAKLNTMYQRGNQGHNSIE